MNRDGANESIWQYKTADYVPRETVVEEGKIFDVLIIGGGITGITTALLLQEAGKSCLLAEAVTLGFGSSSGTTAHLNDFFDTPYNKVIKDFGEPNASLLSKAAKQSMALIRKNINDHQINCSYEEKDAYLFALNEKQDKELEEIVTASQKMGIDTGFISNSPFPFPYLKIARFREQAQFNPVAYILALARAFEDAGGVVREHSRITGFKEGEIIEADCNGEMIRARNIIYATHIPPGVNILHFKCAPYRSYAIAFRLKKGEYPDALGYDMNDPYHYYRSQTIDGEQYLIAGGEDHKTGHEENTSACFRRLESHVRSYFDVESVAFHWSSQYFEPADGLPYIGHLPGNGHNVFVATGFGGNGMIYGTLSALIFRDMLIENDSIYKDLFSPSRIKAIASMGNIIKEAADVVKIFIKAPFSVEQLKEFSELAPGEGKLVKYEDRHIALYKDEQHQLHAVSAACTHINCTINWNKTERSWDCPCHGSRFSIDGEILTAPATKELDKIQLTSEWLAEQFIESKNYR